MRTCIPLTGLVPCGRITRMAAAVVLLAAPFLAGCGKDAVRPAPDGPSQTEFDATLDPAAASFLLARVPGPDGQAGLDVELVGSNLLADLATGNVSIDVAIRSAAREALATPAHIWLANFAPPGVIVLNPDFTEPAEDNTGAGARFGFDYSTLLGEDHLLSPGETSLAKEWQFHVPDGAAFSFSAVAAFGGTPGTAVIAGAVFHDLDADGLRDPDEPPFGGRVVVLRPDGTVVDAVVLEGGAYRVPVTAAGLHTVTYGPPRLGCLCDVEVTTPNPLQVVVPPDENGQPQSYLHADFGARVVRQGEPSPIVLTDLWPEEIQQDPWSFQDVQLRGDLLVMTVGFGGCSVDHGFVLYMSGGFMESNPVQAALVLGHDAHNEQCDAWFVRTLVFDLSPVRQAYEAQYGQAGTVLLQMADPTGQRHVFRYSWGVPGDTNLIPNPSFERDGQPSLDGWLVENAALATLVMGGAPLGGRWALRVEADWAPTTGFVRAIVPGVVDGETIRLSAWLRAEDGGGAMVYLRSGSWQSAPLVSESLHWTEVSLETPVSVAAGDSLWVVASSLHTEIVRRVGYVDGVRVERAGIR